MADRLFRCNGSSSTYLYTNQHQVDYWSFSLA